MTQLTADQKTELLPLLENIATAIEGILLSGLATISESTCQKIDVLLREVSRLRLLRISSSLRIVNEELMRFRKQSPQFSKKRLSFFINRSWLLSHGISRAIRKKDDAELRRLLWTPTQTAVKKLELVTLGVGTKMVPGAFCAFEFRLRTVKQAQSFHRGTSMLWSCVFPLKGNTSIVPEAFLSLPQRQKFKPKSLLENKVIEITNAMVSQEKNGVGRISLTEKSTVTVGKVFTKWDNFQKWDCTEAWQRLKNHEPDPLDLEIELQEEIVLHNWKITAENEREEQHILIIENEKGVSLEAAISKGQEGKKLLEEMRKHNKNKTSKPLYGLIHYERCCLILQPLSLFEQQKMDYINISSSSYNSAALLKTLNF